MACCQNKAFADQSWPHTAIIRATQKTYKRMMQCAMCKKGRWTRNTQYNKINEQLFTHRSIIYIYMNLSTSFTKHNRYGQKYRNTNYSDSKQYLFSLILNVLLELINLVSHTHHIHTIYCRNIGSTRQQSVCLLSIVCLTVLFSALLVNKRHQ